MKSPLVRSDIEGAARAQRKLRITNCDSAVCRNIADLDQMLIVHHGGYVEHELIGRKELSGPDTLRALRLPKNVFAEKIGVVS